VKEREGGRRRAAPPSPFGRTLSQKHALPPLPPLPPAQGFFPTNIPVESIRTTGIAVDFVSRLKLKSPVVVAPNESCIQLAHDIRTGLQKKTGSPVGLAAIMQAGPSRGSDRYAHTLTTRSAAAPAEGVERMELVGDVHGRDVVIVDDMIDTAKTLMTRLDLLKERGAQRIVAYATHGLFTGAALQRITKSPLSDVVVTNTVPLREDVDTRHTHKIAQLSVAPLLAEAILRVQTGQSLQDLRIFDRDSTEPRYKGQE
jgi:ribose-phosphate pyrophosphokinase